MGKKVVFWTAKMLSTTMINPHHYGRRVKYSCGCGTIHGVNWDGDYTNNESPHIDKILKANGCTSLDDLQDIFGIFGYKGHRCNINENK